MRRGVGEIGGRGWKEGCHLLPNLFTAITTVGIAIQRADIRWISAATLLPVPTDRERDAPAPIPDVMENFSSGGWISALRIAGSDLYNGPRRGVRFHLLSAFFTATALLGLKRKIMIE